MKKTVKWMVKREKNLTTSQYGNWLDCIQKFTAEGKFLLKWSTYGSEDGQISRAQDLCYDAKNNWLYVADSCNHRIQVFTTEGKWIKTIGSLDGDKPHMRYPYDVELAEDGSLIVCQYGKCEVMGMGFWRWN